jgi:hypothetical protein
LVRRRVARLEAEEEDEARRPLLVIYCFRNETTYKTLITQPSPERSEEIQEQLAELLFADEK